MIEHRFVCGRGVELHLACAGSPENPLVILLHGFPEFWLEWREIIEPLAQMGFRVVAPDQRGYGLSGKPRKVDDYRLDRLADDVAAIADALGRDRFQLVGHDWGGTVAWWTASRHSRRVRRMAILNAPHPAVWRAAMTDDPAQRRLSRYVQMLRIPVLPEALIRLGGYRGLEQAFAGSVRPEAFPESVMAQYREAWRTPKALPAMLNWYRALFRQPLVVPEAGTITTPVLLIWGDRDKFGVPALADRSAALVRDARLVHWPQASHWTPHDAPEQLLDELDRFLERPA